MEEKIKIIQSELKEINDSNGLLQLEIQELKKNPKGFILLTDKN